MRIYFNSLTLPKKAAKRVRDYFHKPDSFLAGTMTLSEAKQVTAVLLGYGDWHELETVTKLGAHPPSPLDEEVDEDTQNARLEFQATRLEYFLAVRGPTLRGPTLRAIALKLRVSAANPRSPASACDARDSNRIYHWLDTGSHLLRPVDEWRFVPSERSEPLEPNLTKISQGWFAGGFSVGEIVEEVEPILQSQPENLDAYFVMIVPFLDIGYVHEIARHVNALEAEIIRVIPPDFPRRKKEAMPWRWVYNRIFHQSVIILGLALYRLEDYERAGKWFRFSIATTRAFDAFSRAYLEDINRDIPRGDVMFEQ